MPCPPAWSLSKRVPSSDNTASPGPGAYNPHHLGRDTPPKYSFASSRRLNYLTEQSGSQRSLTPVLQSSSSRGFLPNRRSQRKMQRSQVARPLTAEDSPGPGAYDPRYTQSRSDSPVVKIAKPLRSASELKRNRLAHRSEYISKAQLSTPGPGSYELKQGGRQGYKWGHSARALPTDNVKCGFPGPGSYHSEAPNKGGARFGSQRRSSELKAEGPGPGAYGVTSTLSNRRMSMKSGGHSDNLNKDAINTPGPGTYSQPRSHSASFAFSKDRKVHPSERQKDLSPGPAAYSTTQKKSAGFAFSRDNKRLAYPVSDTPGPGLYMSKSLRELPVYSFRGGHSENLHKHQLETPSPAMYRPEPVRDRSPSFRLGKSQRELPKDSVKCNFPGPGTYARPASAGTASHAFPKAGRSRELRSDSPGPGQYNPRPALDAKAFKMGSGHQDNVISHMKATPGPGSYNPESCKDASPSFRLGKMSRNVASESVKHQFPGPGSYHHERRGSAPSPSFGSERRKYRADSPTPGPGAYNPKSSLKCQTYSFQGGHSDNLNKEALRTPAPGAYNPILASTTPVFTAGAKRTLRSESVKFNFPGPGAYSSPSARGNAAKFGSAKRPKTPVSDMPGPGAYQLPSSFSKQSFTFRDGHSDNLNKDVLKNPGPGSYSFDRPRSLSPSYSVSIKRDLLSDAVKNNFPGPGKYSTAKGRSASPEWSFSKNSKRLEFAPSSSPGPGAYPSAGSFTHQSFKFPRKGHALNLNEHAVPNPGPGFYDIPVAVPLPTKYK